MNFFSKGFATIFARSGSHYTKAVALKRHIVKRGWGRSQASTQMYGGCMKKYQMTNFENISVPCLANVGVSHGVGWLQNSTQKYGAGLDKVSNY